MPTHPSSNLPWQTYRDIRLRALQTNPEAFSSTVAREAAFDDATWQQRAASGAHLWVADDEPTAQDGRPDHPLAPRADGIATLTPALIYLDDPSSIEACPDLPDIKRLGFVTQVWVEPGRRSHGIGEAVMEAVIADARQQGMTTLLLHVIADNARAAALYERLGFVERTAPLPECPGNEREFELKLSPSDATA